MARDAGRVSTMVDGTVVIVCGRDTTTGALMAALLARGFSTTRDPGEAEDSLEGGAGEEASTSTTTEISSTDGLSGAGAGLGSKAYNARTTPTWRAIEPVQAARALRQAANLTSSTGIGSSTSDSGPPPGSPHGLARTRRHRQIPHYSESPAHNSTDRGSPDRSPTRPSQPAARWEGSTERTVRPDRLFPQLLAKVRGEHNTPSPVTPVASERRPP